MTNYLPSLKVRAAAELERRRRAGKLSEPYQRFQERYFNDPAGFVRESIGWPDGEYPADYQLEILDGLSRNKRYAVRGLHGLGKSALASWAILWFALTRDGSYDWKIPITASVWRQLEKFLMPELHKWARRLRWDKIGRRPFDDRNELQTLSLNLSTGSAFALASKDPSSLEGAHAEQLLYVLDEAKSIIVPIWDAIDGAFSNAGQGRFEAYGLAMSTPGPTSGRFYDIHVRRPGTQRWAVRHVTLQEAITAGRVNESWVEEQRELWGEKSEMFQNRVLGEFADASEDGVIPLSWVEAAIERWHDRQGLGSGETSYGLDVARFGADKSVLARLVGQTIEWLRAWSKQDTMATVGKVIQALDEYREWNAPIAVDTPGLGGGVFDRLAEQGWAAVDVNVGTSTTMSDKSGSMHFVNLRSALWWMMRELLDPTNPLPIALPDEDLLISDLTAPRWSVTSKGDIQVEKKEDIYKRLGRSTDYADAVILAFYCRHAGRAPSSGSLPDHLQDYRG